MNKQLCEPILEKGIRNTNFFNGRLLTAEDLQVQKIAHDQHLAQLGQALGGGIVHGLEVRITATGADRKEALLSISAGLALTSRGQPLTLPTTTDLVIVPKPTQPLTQGGQFADCPTERPTLTTGIGVYLLLLSPASGFEGRAPLTGLGANGKITGCGDRYQVEGVMFRLIKVEPGNIPGLAEKTVEELAALIDQTDVVDNLTPVQIAALSMLRNRLAHLFFGTESLAAVATDPFALTTAPLQSLYARYGALEALILTGEQAGNQRSYPTRDDVPLALVYWTIGGLRFVDMGSVRRRPATPFSGDPWGVFLGERRQREGEAMLLQFEEQLGALRATARNLESVVAKDFFRYLPAASILPLAHGEQSPRGLDPQIFWSSLKVRDPTADPVYVEGAVVPSLLRESLAYPPIDLAATDSRGERELIWLYRVRENQQAVEASGANRPEAYLVFANGHLPYQAEARYDVNRWNYSHFV